MNGALGLAASIVAMDREALTRLVAKRPPASPDAIEDPLALALDLLRTESITRALQHLDRDHLRELIELSETGSADPDSPRRETLMGLGLVGLSDSQIAPLDEVTETLTAMLASAGVTLTDEQARPDTPARADVGSNTEQDHGDWFVPALTSTQQAATMLRSLAQQPGKVNRRGGVAVVTARTLAEESRSDFEVTKRMLTTLDEAGLTQTVSLPDGSAGKLIVGPRAASWFQLPHVDRWLALASARITFLSPQLRRALELSGYDLERAVASTLTLEYPLVPQSVHDTAAEFSLAAADLGLTSHGALTAAALHLLTGDESAARDVAEQHMPKAVTGVYVQPDLTVIVPGPLSPSDERLLMSLADAEQVGVASTLRITAETLARALDAGNTAEHIRGELERLSLTGIPQPLSFLIEELVRRGSLVVHEHHGDEGRSRIDVVKPALLETLMIDRALHHLQLAPSAAAGNGGAGSSPGSTPQLFSRMSSEHVLTTLLDARYPAVAARSTAAARGAEALRLHTAPDVQTDANEGNDDKDKDDTLAALVDRVYESARSEPDSGDVARRLDLAIRDRSTVRLTASANGQERDFTLLPVALSGGRLRATDVAAGVERTLPLSAIVSVVPAT